ncbi:hypothetical protein [Tsukamurella paurometabola]|uniref:Uncharacterized protein n=1 Tax=Tsukamurella paurometabola TaxID=2061 RepID=A0ABS5NJK9_TSUPA|nr:hypothetical protein [Tsukamurella paurometabola]MBS4104200.1 hypothetical protein [Tsukamurella paurometabola]UEA84278.1 hypothetical protein LK411_05475 [Tsukamurella paurometabola]
MAAKIIALMIEDSPETRLSPVAYWCTDSVAALLFRKRGSSGYVGWAGDIFNETLAILGSWNSEEEAGVTLYHNNVLPDVLDVDPADGEVDCGRRVPSTSD